MKPRSAPVRIALAGLLGLGAIALLTAFKKGDTVYAKKIETVLRADPRPLGAASAKVTFGTALNVQDVTGPWLQVRAADASGWIFEGNVAGEKPAQAPSAGLTKISADSTDTTAAARPLSEAGEAYASRHDSTAARADVEWVDAQSAAISEEDLVAYLRDNEKGEYRK
jgi:hypothetical protein